MDVRQSLKCGACGTRVMAVCCFTPALVLLVGALGLSSWLGWIDYVLLPGLALFAALTVYAAVRLYRRRRAGMEAERETS
ncbi:MAG: mercury resistance system transport protein MerF [Rhodospirillales bacterium]